MTKEQQKQYDVYLDTHITNVANAFDWLSENVGELFDNCMVSPIIHCINNHDDSKWGPEEYDAYVEYFYGERTDKVKDEFNKAWLHHQHKNPHHWEHWLITNEDGESVPVEMEFRYVIEMICDWWSFGWTKGDLYELFSWYKVNSPKMLLHETTRSLVEDILSKIRKKLDEINEQE